MSEQLKMIGGYLVKELLCETRSSQVYRVSAPDAAKTYVVKVLKSNFASALDILSFKQEFAVGSHFLGPQVVNFHDFIHFNNTYGIVLEDFDAIELEQLGPKDLTTYIAIAQQITAGLQDIHSKGYVHKDLTLSNILINPESLVVKINDFGLAEPATTVGQNISDHILGTLPYISPEQTGRSNRVLEYRSDFYSLGVCLYRLFSGQFPFIADSIIGYMHCHLAVEPTPLFEANPKLPESLNSIVIKLLAKDPDERYQSIYGIRKDLEIVLKHLENPGREHAFHVARYDTSSRFYLCEKLYGRQEALGALNSVFDNAISDSPKLCMVKGPPGIGKSKLIAEFCRHITKKRGRSMFARFEQFEQAMPYAGFNQAVDNLMQQLFTYGSSELEDLKARLILDLGEDRWLLNQQLPAFLKILPSQKPNLTLELDVQLSKLKDIVVKAFSCFASSSQPLVIILDDLQWSDQMTLDLMFHLAESSIVGFMIIGSYRDNEVGEGHSLDSSLKAFSKKGTLAIVRLSVLGAEAISELITETFKNNATDIWPLVEMIHNKTGGNPFYVREFVTQLEADRAIFYDQDKGYWLWDIDRIKLVSATQNVLHFIAGQIAELPKESIQLLQIAACIGHKFDLKVIARVMGKSLLECYKLIEIGIDLRMIYPMGGSCRFLRSAENHSDSDWSLIEFKFCFDHDQIQEAFMNSIVGDELGQTHLTLGRYFFEEKYSNYLLNGLKHKNQCIELINDQKEIYELCLANIEASKVARTSNENILALGFVAKSKACFSKLQDKEKGLLSKILAESCYNLTQLGKYVEAEKDANRVLELTDDLEIKADVLKHLIHTYTLASDFEASVLYSLKALKLMGMAFPKEPTKLDIIFQVIRTKWFARNIPDDITQWVEVKESKVISLIGLGYEAIVNSYLANQQNLSILLTAKFTEITFRHGKTKYSAYFICIWAVMCGILGDIEEEKRYTFIAKKLVTLTKDNSLLGRFYTSFLYLNSQWHYAFNKSEVMRKLAWNTAVDSGNLYLIASAAGILSIDYHDRDLPVLLVESEKSRDMLQGKNIDVWLAMQNTTVAFYEILSAAGQFEEKVQYYENVVNNSKELMFEKQFATGISVIAFCEIQLGLLMRDYSVLVDVVDIFFANRFSIGNSLREFEGLLYSGVLYFRNMNELSPTVRRLGLKRVKISEKIIEKRTSWNPQNFSAYRDFFMAEKNIFMGKYDVAIQLFEKAQATAKENGLFLLLAIVSEAMCHTYITAGDKVLAERYYKDATNAFKRWGAFGMVECIRERYEKDFFASGADGYAGILWKGKEVSEAARELSHGTSSNAASQVELEVISSSLQYICSEGDLASLRENLVRKMLEISGAETCVLLMKPKQTDSWHMVSRLSNDTSEESVEIGEEIPLSVLNFVEKSREIFQISDASTSTEFGDHPVVKKRKIRSILCLPLVHQAKLVAILYLENNLAKKAFSASCSNLVSLLGIQAAISIENANLYQELEQQVAEKTRDITTLLHHLEQGIFTIEAQGVVSPQYSKHLEVILGHADIVGRKAVHVLFTDSYVNQDKVEQMSYAILAAIDSSSLDYMMNKHLLLSEFQRQSAFGDRQTLELTWNPILDEDNRVLRIMVTVRDITDYRAAQVKSRMKTRELDAIEQLLSAGPDTALKLLVEVSDLLSRCFLIVESSPRTKKEKVMNIMRDVHTMKGVSRFSNFKEIADACHRAEEALLEVAENVGWTEVKDVLNVIKFSRDFYNDVAFNKLKLNKLAMLENTEDVSGLESGQQGGGGRLFHAERLAEKSYNPKGELHFPNCIGRLFEQTKNLARDMGKPEPRFQLEGEGFAITSEQAQMLTEVFVHLLRNAIDHGLEFSAERIAKQKPTQGTITMISAKDHGENVVILKDDGEGINCKSVWERYLQKNPTADEKKYSDLDIAELIFQPFLSTKNDVTDVSGRGFGMETVRCLIRESGGEISIQLAEGFDETRRNFQYRIRLPKVG